ncbi:unnamed protein product, partial [Bubo scandiacus]
MVRQAVPCSPWVLTVEQISTCSLWRTPHQSRGMCSKKAVTPWEAHAGAGSWQNLWSHGERSPPWSRFAGRTCDPFLTYHKLRIPLVIYFCSLQEKCSFLFLSKKSP